MRVAITVRFNYKRDWMRVPNLKFRNEKPSLKFVFFAESALPPSKIHTLFASVAAGKYSAHCRLSMEDLNQCRLEWAERSAIGITEMEVVLRLCGTLVATSRLLIYWSMRSARDMTLKRLFVEQSTVVVYHGYFERCRSF